MPASKNYLFACFSLLIWSCTSVLLLSLKHVPSFLLEGLIMFSGGSVLVASYHKQLQKSEFKLWGLIGIAGNQMLFLLSIRRIPVPMADFIFAMWPILLLVVRQRLQLSAKQVFAVLLAILAMFVLYKPHTFDAIGILLAFLSSACWSVYVLKTSQSNACCFMLGIYLILGAIICLLLSYIFAEQCSLNYQDLMFIGATGLGPSAFAYVFWQKAVSCDAVVKISWLSFFLPITGYLMLLANHLINFDYSVLTALILICFSSFIIFA